MKPRILPQDWLDVAFVAVLSMIALLAWESTYLGAGLWLAGLGAIVAGLGVAVAVVALGGGLDFIVVGLVAVYLLGSGAGPGAFDGWVPPAYRS